MSNIYELTNEFKAIEAQLHDEDCDVESFTALLGSIKCGIKDKVINQSFVIKNLENTLDGIDGALNLMKNRKKTIEDKIDALKDAAIKAMLDTKLKKIETDYFNVSLRESKKVIIDDEAKLAAEFIRTKTISEPDKVRIKEHMAECSLEKIDGAHLEVKNSLQIK